MPSKFSLNIVLLLIVMKKGLNLTHKERRLGFDILFYFHVILTPLMGFYNACVYYYPRWIKLQEQNKEESKLRLLMKMLKINNSQCDCCLWRGKRGEMPVGNAINDEELHESFL